MSVIIIPRRHYTQPQGRVTVANGWREKGLRGLLTSTPFNFADDKFVTGVSIPSIATPFGVALNPQKSAASYVEFPFELSTALSVFCLASRDGAVDTSGVGAVAAVASNRTATQPAYWEANLGNGFGAFSDKEKPRFSNNAEGIGAIYINGAVRAGTNPCDLSMVQGVFYSVLFATSVGALSSGSGVTRAFNIAGQFGVSARIPVFAIFDKNLLASDAVALHENPWQLFRADPIRIYSLPSGPISISWSSLTASNITQTGARLTLGGITR